MIETFTKEPIQWIDKNGKPLKELPKRYTVDFLKKLHREMLFAREFDRKLTVLLKQGKTTFYAQSTGIEATQVGIAHSIRIGHDWIWSYYRDCALALSIGIPAKEIFGQSIGTYADPSKGRQMPQHFGSNKLNFVSMSSSIASQVPPAAGCAIAQKYLNTDEITICTFGDGATSEGDWHAGINMATVNQAPIVFVCENNQWAISTQLHEQMASENINIKAKAYGIDGYYVDGNDIIAVLEVLGHVIEKVRKGGMPVLVECLTYRIGAHSNSDADAEKNYRSREEVAIWQNLDPIVRLENLLEYMGNKIENKEEMLKEINAEIEKAAQIADAAQIPGAEAMFEDVYSDKPIHLLEQENFLKKELQKI